MMLPATVLTALASALLVASYQTPTIHSCASVQRALFSNVRISGAKLGETTHVDFNVNITRPLTSEPTIRFTIWTADGTRLWCMFGMGSCEYKLCEGTSRKEQMLGELWENKCPVPALALQWRQSFILYSISQIVIGWAPTTLKIRAEITDGGVIVGCYWFEATIYPAS
ncbi:uncharacterized protein LOC144141501 [Haemaphysalis longicornis]